MTTDNIARADEIVGLKKLEDWPHLSHCWWAEDIRRTRYLKWLDENAPNAATFSFRDDLTRLADGVVAAHAAKHPQPSDGLPPGPWRSYKNGEHEYAILDANTCTVAWTKADSCATWINRPNLKKVYAYLARCGSPAVRSILAACDDAELERWAKIIDQYQIASACDAIVTAEFTTRGIGALPTGEITLFCGARRK